MTRYKVTFIEGTRYRDIQIMMRTNQIPFESIEHNCGVSGPYAVISDDDGEIFENSKRKLKRLYSFRELIQLD